MKHPAEIAAEGMEKEGLLFTTAALIAAGLAAAPTVTRGLNWLTGHDAKKKVQRAQLAAEAQQEQPQLGPAPGMNPMQPPRGPMPMMRMPHGPMPQGMLAAANGLHNYRAGQPGF